MEDLEEENVCQRHGNKIYDYFTIFISLLDLLTDIMILIEFYQLNRMIYFYVSLGILTTAQISYVIAFISRYIENTLCGCALFLCILPFAPFASIAIYIIEAHGVLGNLYNGHSVENINKSPLQKWMQKKVRSHLGFILEATIEAFPQSILQMVAIVYYKEYNNYLAISSILISMWSVSSKSFVFAAGSAFDKYTLIFNWLCVVIDFFGLFFIISWIFYNETIFYIFFSQFVVCILPFAFWSMLAFWMLCIAITFGDYVYEIDNRWVGFMIGCCCCSCIFVGITAFTAICFCIFVMLLQIFHWTYIALILYSFGTNRYHFENKTNAIGYNHVISWINNANKVNYKKFAISKKQDRIIRIAATNQYMLNKWSLCKPLPTLTAYLADNYRSAFQRVTYRGLRCNTDLPKQSKFVAAFFGAYGGLFWDKVETFKNPQLFGRERRIKRRNSLQGAIFFFPVVYLFGPLYIMSRCIGLCIPVIIIVDELANSSHKFEWDFQWFMFIIYIIGEIAILCLLVGKVLRLQHIMWHILPSRSLVVPFSNDINKANVRIEELKFSYSKMIELPMIKQLLIIKFSHDITDIILAFMWKQDEAFPDDT